MLGRRGGWGEFYLPVGLGLRTELTIKVVGSRARIVLFGRRSRYRNYSGRWTWLLILCRRWRKRLLQRRGASSTAAQRGWGDGGLLHMGLLPSFLEVICMAFSSSIRFCFPPHQLSNPSNKSLTFPSSSSKSDASNRLQSKPSNNPSISAKSP